MRKKYAPAMTGTSTSSTLTVAFLRSTMTAATATSRTVEYSGGMPKAFLKAEDTELPITWLMPHQQMRPDAAKHTASTERLSFLPRHLSARACR